MRNRISNKDCIEFVNFLLVNSALDPTAYKPGLVVVDAVELNYTASVEYIRRASKVHESDSKVYKKYSFKTWQQLFFRFLERLKRSGKTCTAQSYRSFNKELVSAPEYGYSIYFEISGVELVNKEFEYGNFKIISRERFLEIEGDSNLLGPDETSPTWLDKFKLHYVICVSGSGSDINKIVENQTEKVENVVHLFNYIIGSARLWGLIRLPHYAGPVERIVHAVCHDKNHKHFKKIDKSPLPFTIDEVDSFIFKESNGNKYIWELYAKSNRSNLEENILRAIFWIGEGVANPNPFLACLQFASALELVCMDKTNRSNMKQIVCEYGAYLSSDIMEERLEMKQRISDLFDIRNDAAHGKNINPLSADEVNQAIVTSKDFIRALLNRMNTDSFNDIDGLKRFITNKKYS